MLFSVDLDWNPAPGLEEGSRLAIDSEVPPPRADRTPSDSHGVGNSH